MIRITCIAAFAMSAGVAGAQVINVVDFETQVIQDLLNNGQGFDIQTGADAFTFATSGVDRTIQGFDQGGGVGGSISLFAIADTTPLIVPVGWFYGLVIRDQDFTPSMLSSLDPNLISVTAQFDGRNETGDGIAVFGFEGIDDNGTPGNVSDDVPVYRAEFPIIANAVPDGVYQTVGGVLSSSSGGFGTLDDPAIDYFVYTVNINNGTSWGNLSDIRIAIDDITTEQVLPEFITTDIFAFNFDSAAIQNLIDNGLGFDIGNDAGSNTFAYGLSGVTTGDARFEEFTGENGSIKLSVDINSTNATQDNWFAEVVNEFPPGTAPTPSDFPTLDPSEVFVRALVGGRGEDNPGAPLELYIAGANSLNQRIYESRWEVPAPGIGQLTPAGGFISDATGGFGSFDDPNIVVYAIGVRINDGTLWGKGSDIRLEMDSIVVQTVIERCEFDRNADNSVDALDVLDFLGGVEAGCP